MYKEKKSGGLSKKRKKGEKTKLTNISKQREGINKGEKKTMWLCVCIRWMSGWQNNIFFKATEDQGRERERKGE